MCPRPGVLILHLKVLEGNGQIFFFYLNCETFKTIGKFSYSSILFGVVYNKGKLGLGKSLWQIGIALEKKNPVPGQGHFSVTQVASSRWPPDTISNTLAFL